MERLSPDRRLDLLRFNPDDYLQVPDRGSGKKLWKLALAQKESLPFQRQD